MGGRRKGREFAVQMLFQWDLCKETFESVRDTFWTLNHDVDQEIRDFADRLASGAAQNTERIDVLLARHAEHWRVSRMATVDRNILRSATF